MDLHQRQRPFILLQMKRGGQENTDDRQNHPGAQPQGFNLHKQIGFQAVTRGYCSHSKHIMNMNCWLALHRTLSWEVNPTHLPNSHTGRSSVDQLDQPLEVSSQWKVCSVSARLLSQRPHITSAPLSGLDRPSGRSGLFSALWNGTLWAPDAASQPA